MTKTIHLYRVDEEMLEAQRLALRALADLLEGRKLHHPNTQESILALLPALIGVSNMLDHWADKRDGFASPSNEG